MKSPIATTPEQYERLKACGVDPKTADMYYTNYATKPNDGIPIVKTVPLGIRKDLIPAWSTSRLLSLLPKEIESDVYDYIWLEIVWTYEDGKVATIKYYAPPLHDYSIEYDAWEFTDENIIEAIVQAIEWLTENGYKLNEIEE